MADVLITGASGFLGSSLAAQLHAQGHRVHAIARPGTVLPDGIDHLVGDLGDPSFLAALPPRIDTVIHLAQSRNHRRFPECATDIFAVNVQSTALLADYARRAGARRFVFTSSGGVYGYRAAPWSETDAVAPTNYYLSSKYAAELLLMPYASAFPIIILRPFFLYGPGQSGMLIANLIKQVADGKTVTIDGDQGLRINPCYLGDAVQAITATLTLAESATFNLCGDDAATLSGLVAIIAGRLGVAAQVEHRATPPPGDLLGDNRRLKRLLGSARLTGLAEGIARTIGQAMP